MSSFTHSSNALHRDGQTDGKAISTANVYYVTPVKTVTAVAIIGLLSEWDSPGGSTQQRGDVLSSNKTALRLTRHASNCHNFINKDKSLQFI